MEVFENALLLSIHFAVLPDLSTSVNIEQYVHSITLAYSNTGYLELYFICIIEWRFDAHTSRNR